MLISQRVNSHVAPKEGKISTADLGIWNKMSIMAGGGHLKDSFAVFIDPAHTGPSSSQTSS